MKTQTYQPSEAKAHGKLLVPLFGNISGKPVKLAERRASSGTHLSNTKSRKNCQRHVTPVPLESKIHVIHLTVNKVQPVLLMTNKMMIYGLCTRLHLCQRSEPNLG